MLRFHISLARSAEVIWRDFEISEQVPLVFFGQVVVALFFDEFSDGKFQVEGRKIDIAPDRAQPGAPLLEEILSAPGSALSSVGFPMRRGPSTWSTLRD